MKTDSSYSMGSQVFFFLSHFSWLVLVPNLLANDEEKTLPAIPAAAVVKAETQDGKEELTFPIREAQPMQPEKQDVEKSWKRRDIREIQVDIREKAEAAPEDRSNELDYGNGIWADQYFQPTVFNWEAPDIYYAQLYFEDVSLERYGQTSGPYRQFIRSGIHFYRAVATLPNKFRNERPYELESPLGFCRPGSPAPLTRTRHYRSLHR